MLSQWQNLVFFLNRQCREETHLYRSLRIFFKEISSLENVNGWAYFIVQWVSFLRIQCRIPRQNHTLITQKQALDS